MLGGMPIVATDIPYGVTGLAYDAKWDKEEFIVAVNNMFRVASYGGAVMFFCSWQQFALLTHWQENAAAKRKKYNTKYQATEELLEKATTKKVKEKLRKQKASDLAGFQLATYLHSSSEWVCLPVPTLLPLGSLIIFFLDHLENSTRVVEWQEVCL
jgi:hypothetical protein